MEEKRRITTILTAVLVASALIRGFVAGFIEFGFDEVYYRTYALFPDLSHFDHPPMVGWVIQLFTLNLLLDHEFFIRLASVIFGTVNTWLIYKIGTTIKNERTGLFAAILYSTSFYAFVVCGIFILPDTPQSFFWLLSLWFLLKSLPDKNCSRGSRNYLFVSGITIGLALLSKYHAVFLITGAFLYILIYNRAWFRVKETWYAFILILLFCTPIILWNYDNDFISFTFHGERTLTERAGWIHPEFFLTEVVGEFFYNNPVNFILVVIAFISLMKGQDFLSHRYRNLILWISFPLVITFLVFSLFARTLPHWTGPAYTGFILIASAWLDQRSKSHYTWKLFPRPLRIASYLLLLLIILAVGQIRYGWIPLTRWDIQDVTHDMFGWRQLGEKFKPIAAFDRDLLLIDSQAPLFTFRWFPAANYQFYVAKKLNKKVYALGSPERIHKYHWIDRDNGNLPIGMDAYYIALSDDYADPWEQYGNLFTVIQPSDTISILRGHELVRKAFIFRLIGLKEELVFIPSDTLEKPDPEIEKLLFFQRQIRNDSVWLRILQKKADEKKISLETMIVLEAQSMLDREKEVRKNIRELDSLKLKIPVQQKDTMVLKSE